MVDQNRGPHTCTCIFSTIMDKIQRLEEMSCFCNDIILSSLVWVCQKVMQAVLITKILLRTKRTKWISKDLGGALLVHFSCTGVTQVI